MLAGSTCWLATVSTTQGWFVGATDGANSGMVTLMVLPGQAWVTALKFAFGSVGIVKVKAIERNVVDGGVLKLIRRVCDAQQ